MKAKTPGSFYSLKECIDYGEHHANTKWVRNSFNEFSEERENAHCREGDAVTDRQKWLRGLSPSVCK